MLEFHSSLIDNIVELLAYSSQVRYSYHIQWCHDEHENIFIEVLEKSRIADRDIQLGQLLGSYRN